MIQLSHLFFDVSFLRTPKLVLLLFFPFEATQTRAPSRPTWKTPEQTPLEGVPFTEAFWELPMLG